MSLKVAAAAASASSLLKRNVGHHAVSIFRGQIQTHRKTISRKAKAKTLKHRKAYLQRKRAQIISFRKVCTCFSFYYFPFFMTFRSVLMESGACVHSAIRDEVSKRASRKLTWNARNGPSFVSSCLILKWVYGHKIVCVQQRHRVSIFAPGSSRHTASTIVRCNMNICWEGRGDETITISPK